MTDVVMLEAALFQLRAATGEIDRDVAPQLALCVNVLGNAIAAGRDGVNASVASDIEFAFNDLSAAVDELPQSEADRLAPMMATLRRDVEALTAATALDPAVIAQIGVFQSKLRERMKAIEHQTFVEGSSEPLPHPPEALRDEAIPIARQLAAAGFATPALNALIADPASTRLYSLRDIADELNVILG
ncbi:MAG: hypothetical protein QOE68_867 [Thermoanaerobaculia bacterium]|jgi:hypothetical protein|nr:hypothetical protein [Thermoanaerobaculia bacterium]